MDPFKVRKNLYPLCNIDRYSVLCYKHGSFYSLNTLDNSLIYLISAPFPFIKRFLSYSILLRRYYGLYNIKAVRISEINFLVFGNHTFYLLDIANKEISKIPGNNCKSILHLSTSTIGPIWGEYGYNPHKESKSIFCFDKDSRSIKLLYTFKKGEINHIHRIVEDRKTGRLYILTGDFDSSAAIYYTDDSFVSVKRLYAGSQEFRSCCAIADSGRLVYATDSPVQVNHLKSIEDLQITDITELNGSCIHSCIINNNLVCSTTVENQPNELDNSKNKYKYNLGKGIKDWYVEIFSYNVDKKAYTIVLRDKKDILPMLAFGYGCFHFPILENDYEGPLLAYGYSTKKYDQKLISLNIT